MATKTWSGLALDQLWSTPGNWVGGVVPTGTDDVVFTFGAATACFLDDPGSWSGGSITVQGGFAPQGLAITAPVTVGAILLDDAGSYIALIADVTAASITVHDGDFIASAALTISGILTQTGGTISMGTGDVVSHGFVNLNGGTSTSTSGTWRVIGASFLVAGATFIHNGGTIVLDDSTGGGASVGGDYTDETAYNVVRLEFSNTGSICYLLGKMSFATFQANDGASDYTIAIEDPTNHGGTPYTFGEFLVEGAAGKLVTLAPDSGTDFTLTTTGGVVACDYLSISHSVVDASPAWYAGSHSTNGGNTSNWIFGDPPSPPSSGGKNSAFYLDPSWR